MVNYRDHWAIPGCYVDLNETPQTAATREPHEARTRPDRPRPAVSPLGLARLPITAAAL
jgi:ADP-ribose pyrophosphatase YjhB (NUDIX family)